MKHSRILVYISLLTLAASSAQNVPPTPEEDPVQKAIREFNRRDSGKPNEVTVVLATTEGKTNETPGDGKPNDAVLVTGNAPEASEVVDASTETTEPAADADSETPKPAISQEKPEPKPGLAVRVEKLHAEGQVIDASKVKLRAPFPAKPLAQAPAGWRIETSENTPPFSRDIELESGKTITLSVRPHVLVPETDGVESFAIAEPGFEHSLGYEQATTVSSILSQSVRQLESDSKELGVAIDTLQQILVTLPKPEPVPQDNK